MIWIDKEPGEIICLFMYYLSGEMPLKYGKVCINFLKNWSEKL